MVILTLWQGFSQKLLSLLWAFSPQQTQQFLLFERRRREQRSRDATYEKSCPLRGQCLFLLIADVMIKEQFPG